VHVLSLERSDPSAVSVRRAAAVTLVSVALICEQRDAFSVMAPHLAKLRVVLEVGYRSCETFVVGRSDCCLLRMQASEALDRDDVVRAHARDAIATVRQAMERMYVIDKASLNIRVS
jgi:hypothetical protein